MDYDLKLTIASPPSVKELGSINSYVVKENDGKVSISYFSEDSEQSLNDLICIFVESIKNSTYNEFEGALLNVAIYFDVEKAANLNISLSANALQLLSEIKAELNISCYPCTD